MPAIDLTVATRILAHRGVLAPDGRVAALVGSEVVYLAGRGVSASTMTPYDVCALRLGDGTVLAGDAPDDVERYLRPLRVPGRGAIAATIQGDVAGADLADVVRLSADISWDEAVSEARAVGALIGAYPADAGRSDINR